MLQKRGREEGESRKGRSSVPHCLPMRERERYESTRVTFWEMKGVSWSRRGVKEVYNFFSQWRLDSDLPILGKNCSPKLSSKVYYHLMEKTDAQPITE